GDLAGGRGAAGPRRRAGRENTRAVERLDARACPCAGSERGARRDLLLLRRTISRLRRDLVQPAPLSQCDRAYRDRRPRCGCLPAWLALEPHAITLHSCARRQRRVMTVEELLAQYRGPAGVSVDERRSCAAGGRRAVHPAWRRPRLLVRVPST